MSLKSRLKSMGLATAVATSAVFGAHASETHETEKKQVGICHWESGVDNSKRQFWVDDSIEGVRLASTKGLPVIEQRKNWMDVLDPERKYRSDLSPDVIALEQQLNDGVMNSSQKYNLKSGKEKSKQVFQSESIHGEVHAIDGKNGAVVEFKRLAISEENVGGKNKLTDSTTGCGFHLKTQTDRRQVQQWYQDSMNAVLISNVSQQKKDIVLNLLVSGMGATMSPILDHSLPNPDQVQVLSGDMQLPRKMLEKAQREDKMVHFKGLQPTKSGKNMMFASLKNGAHSK